MEVTMAGALRHMCTVCLIATFLFAGSAQAQDDIASGPRERILAASLLDTTPRRLDMVHNDHFMPVAPYGDALHDFSGLLVVSETVAQPVDGRFPGFSIAFFSHDGFLIPVERDIVSGGPGKWDLIFSPGRVWSEESDGGWSRASFPFALVGKVWGNAHNGIATFSLQRLGSLGPEVSDRSGILTDRTIRWPGTSSHDLSSRPGREP